MTKEEALAMIDTYKNKLIDPVEMLHWTWLRVIIAHMNKNEWEAALARALPVLTK